MAQVLGAALVHGLLALALALLGARIEARAGHPAIPWVWQRLYLPMLRAGALALFVLLAYPALFGLPDAPPLAALLLGESGRLSRFVGAVFLVSLLVPLVPGVGAPALALPLQGAAASALLFAWLAGAEGLAAPRYWPGGAGLGLAAVLAYAAWWVARQVAARLDEAGLRRWNLADAGQVAFQALLLFLQVPAILAYSLGLGRQLGPG
jgi:hypothetical protein